MNGQGTLQLKDGTLLTGDFPQSSTKLYSIVFNGINYTNCTWENNKMKKATTKIVSEIYTG